MISVVIRTKNQAVALEFLLRNLKERYANDIAEVVVIDTTGRAIEGEENSADSYREFARTTGLALKRAGIACVRTDHAGKKANQRQYDFGEGVSNEIKKRFLRPPIGNEIGEEPRHAK